MKYKKEIKKFRDAYVCVYVVCVYVCVCCDKH